MKKWFIRLKYKLGRFHYRWWKYNVIIVGNGGFSEIDHMIEDAIVHCCKLYLEKELGHISDFTDEEIEGNEVYKPHFHRGYRVHHVGNEEHIDLCLAVIEARDKMRDVGPLRGLEQREEFTRLLVELIEKRGHLWA